ncbi:MAG: PilZ domain-containing protein [Bacillota bacterium]
MMQLLLPEAETFVKIQQRQFVRLDVTLDTAIHPEHSEFTPFRTLTEDISAGGASIRLLKGTAIPIGFAIIPVDGAYVEIR